MRCYLAIPTYNGGGLWTQVVENIRKYAPEDLFVHVIDSNSSDNTVLQAVNAGFDVLSIDSSSFNHGGTRNLAIDQYYEKYDVVIFLTQDSIPEKDFIQNIISAFNDEKVSCAYGRQLPHISANPIAQHARYFNYSSKSYNSELGTIPLMGLKAVFMSNSFSAYRLSVFKELGGFPSNTILCEDMFFAAKALIAGYKIAYVADAMVKHSHNYTPIEEFKRYFDIGVFHSKEKWIRDKFGRATGEGRRFILSEFRFLFKNRVMWIPIACLNNFMKILGYKLGGGYKWLPKFVIKKCSMHKRYWK